MKKKFPLFFVQVGEDHRAGRAGLQVHEQSAGQGVRTGGPGVEATRQQSAAEPDKQYAQTRRGRDVPVCNRRREVQASCQGHIRQGRGELHLHLYFHPSRRLSSLPLLLPATLWPRYAPSPHYQWGGAHIPPVQFDDVISDFDAVFVRGL
uniref:Uncharacterized protein n=1 Tax=Cacopsylla melanoneura TaxID=428564 RepID=A0A8D8TDU7_9HEMI